MTDLRVIFDHMVVASTKAGAVLQLADKVAEAKRIDRRECGNCVHWMKSRQCPRERNVHGRAHGPSMGEPACPKFEIEPHVITLKARLMTEASAFAALYGLPDPRIVY